MKHTIEAMKRSGLFESLVSNIYNKDMPKDAVESVIFEVCDRDEDFEDIFIADIHSLGVNIIWEELQEAVSHLPKKEKKQDTVEDLLKKVIELLENR